jgi:hypothetical protein
MQLKKYLFGVVFPDGNRKLYTANSSNHAKQIRKQFVNRQDVIISPVLKIDRIDKLPAIFSTNVHIKKEVKS